MKLPLLLHYETCNEDGAINVPPCFTGEIIDSEGRVICQADSELHGIELIVAINDLLENTNAVYAQIETIQKKMEIAEIEITALNAKIESILDAIIWERECRDAHQYVLCAKFKTSRVFLNALISSKEFWGEACALLDISSARP